MSESTSPPPGGNPELFHGRSRKRWESAGSTGRAFLDESYVHPVTGFPSGEKSRAEKEWSGIENTRLAFAQTFLGKRGN